MQLLKLFFLALVIYYVPRFCYDKTEGFALTKIHSNLVFEPNWDVKNGPLPEVFDQKFSYLAAGGQVYAFVSEDGKYVLKFFKHHLRRLPFWLKILPLPKHLATKRKNQRKKRTAKLLRDFRSYKLSFENLMEETGLLYVHLNKTNSLRKTVRIVDKIGIEHKINLDQVEFVLQKKADLALSYFSNLIQEKKLSKAKDGIDSICELILTRCKKGIYDEDPRIHRNVGFIDGKAILIDVGRLKFDPRREDPKIQKEDLVKITRRLYTFLQKESPELAEYLEEKIYE
ncbi:MAG: hypothetical protein K1000chlam3_00572 [Chlamydiae bacterium]|nr:hypothetical protein [Chlamydiota bacterium]